MTAGINSIYFRKIAKKVYFGTPFRWLRKVYVDIYWRLVNNRTVTDCIEGINYELDLREMIDFSIFIGSYELDVRNAISEYCSQGMVILDVGANIGAHTLHMAQMVGDRGCVYAFEPTEYAFQKLLRNIALNPILNVKPFRVALSNANISRDSINFRASWLRSNGRQDYPCNVDFVTLDAWATENGLDRIDFIKMDVDGNENGVFNGGLETIFRERPVMVLEASNQHLARDDENPFIKLEDEDYCLFEARSRRSMTVSEMKKLFAPVRGNMTASINILALPKERIF